MVALPAATQPWAGSRDATQAAPVCVQPAPDGNGAIGSEDCLYLNITTPVISRSDARRPVLAWIHGGGFVSSAGSQYDPARLVVQCQTVVVTVNYRLGALPTAPSSSTPTATRPTSTPSSASRTRAAQAPGFPHSGREQRPEPVSSRGPPHRGKGGLQGTRPTRSRHRKDTELIACTHWSSTFYSPDRGTHFGRISALLNDRSTTNSSE
jgi:hypothetical protein